MKKTIEFYFDFSSPYGYFAATRIDALAARHDRVVTYRPILLGAVFKTTGQQPLTTIPLKGSYAKRDLERCARLLGVPFKLPTRFPIAGTTPSRAFYSLVDKDPDLAAKLARALYSAYFSADRDISAPETTVDVAGTLGIDKTQLSHALEEPAVKERLRREVDAAVALGVFGSPYIVVDSEPFWGVDRLDHVEKWLATGGW
jgi:2-hydroxychromene-2-carboxylate isomerase